MTVIGMPQSDTGDRIWRTLGFLAILWMDMASQREAFEAYYGGMTEEQILLVAKNQKSLVPIAREVLADELRKRGMEAAIEASTVQAPPAEELQKRHGCLTAYLVCFLVVTAASILLLLMVNIRRFYPNAPSWVGFVVLILALVNLLCVIALFRWRRWGFWGLCVTSVLGVATNSVIGIGMAESISGFLGILLLYGVLRIGGTNSGWVRLK